MFWIILVILSLYLFYCFKLHKDRRIIFFYSYLDIIITMINPIIIIISLWLLNTNSISGQAFIFISSLSTILSFLILWVVTYRANSGALGKTIFVIVAKFILGIIFIFIGLAILGIHLFYSPERKKYERKSKYSKRASQEKAALVASGMSLVYLIIEYCCINEDFSFPDSQ